MKENFKKFQPENARKRIEKRKPEASLKKGLPGSLKLEPGLFPGDGLPDELDG
ncbi:MAG: hypothetical protein GXO14_05245, partial [Thermococci archaeon]|nr:hypothetical protein [Thermococci archaeon]